MAAATVVVVLGMCPFATRAGAGRHSSAKRAPLSTCALAPLAVDRPQSRWRLRRTSAHATVTAGHSSIGWQASQCSPPCAPRPSVRRPAAARAAAVSAAAVAGRRRCSRAPGARCAAVDIVRRRLGFHCGASPAPPPPLPPPRCSSNRTRRRSPRRPRSPCRCAAEPLRTARTTKAGRGNRLLPLSAVGFRRRAGRPSTCGSSGSSSTIRSATGHST